MLYYAENALLPAFDAILRDAEQKIRQLVNLDIRLKVHLPQEEEGPFTLEMMVLLCEMFDVTWKDVLSQSREKPLPFVRQLFCYFVNNYTELGVQKIGRIIKKDHSTVLHNVKTIAGYIEVKDPETLKAVNSLVKVIHAAKEKSGEFDEVQNRVIA